MYFVFMFPLFAFVVFCFSFFVTFTCKPLQFVYNYIVPHVPVIWCFEWIKNWIEIEHMSVVSLFEVINSLNSSFWCKDRNITGIENCRRPWTLYVWLHPQPLPRFSHRYSPSKFENKIYPIYYIIDIVYRVNFSSSNLDGEYLWFQFDSDVTYLF